MKLNPWQIVHLFLDSFSLPLKKKKSLRWELNKTFQEVLVRQLVLTLSGQMDELISQEVLKEIIFLIVWSLNIWATLFLKWNLKLKSCFQFSSIFWWVMLLGWPKSIFYLNQHPNESSQCSFCMHHNSSLPSSSMFSLYCSLCFFWLPEGKQSAFFVYDTNRVESESNENKILVRIWEEGIFIHTCKSWFIKCEGWGEENFIFRHSEPIRSFPLHASMWVCPRVRLSIFWPAECRARAHLLHHKCETVTGTSGHTVKSWNFKPPVSAWITAGSVCARQWELSQSVCFNRLK